MRFPDLLAVGLAVGLAAGCGRLGFDPLGRGALGDDEAVSDATSGDAAPAVCAPACGIGSYCQGADGCSGPGTCMTATPPDLLCPDVFEPVCGCDGFSFSNDCERSKAGVAKASDGECGGGSI